MFYNSLTTGHKYGTISITTAFNSLINQLSAVLGFIPFTHSLEDIFRLKPS